MEHWKDIKNYEGLYQVSNLGRIKSFPKKTRRGCRIIFPAMRSKDFYPGVSLCKNGKAKTTNIHRLVADHFIENKDNKKFINHIDGNKLNYSVNNLEWVTASENMRHAHKNGLMKLKKGEDSHYSKLKNDDILFIRKSSLKNIDLSKKFNVCPKTIRRIKNRTTWKHL